MVSSIGLLLSINVDVMHRNCQSGDPGLSPSTQQVQNFSPHKIRLFLTHDNFNCEKLRYATLSSLLDFNIQRYPLFCKYQKVINLNFKKCSSYFVMNVVVSTHERERKAFERCGVCFLV